KIYFQQIYLFLMNYIFYIQYKYIYLLFISKNMLKRLFSIKVLQFNTIKRLQKSVYCDIIIL
ncbi:hypothetical protein C4279_12815, partial [Clostridioides difficile]|nr:hypothetical protein [Clostridioides difficile]